MVSGFFTRKITQVASVGDLLEQRRLALGIAIERIARETQVQARYLRALELGDASKLPAEIYVRGFLRTYATYLRLDAETLIQRWNKERGISKHLVRQAAEHAAQAHTFQQRKPLLPKVRVTPTAMRAGLIALGAVTVGLYLLLSITNLTRAPELALEEPTSDRVVTDSSIVVVGQTKPSAQLTINGQPVHVSDDGHFRETLNLQQGINEVVIAARNKLGAETKIVRRIQANLSPIAAAKQPNAALASLASGAEAAATSSNGVDLDVTIHQEATAIVVEVDGKIEFDGTLLPGVSKTFHGDQQVLLTSDKAQFTEVQWGAGESVPRLGQGLVRRVAFTPHMTAQDLSLTAARQ